MKKAGTALVLIMLVMNAAVSSAQEATVTKREKIEIRLLKI